MMIISNAAFCSHLPPRGWSLDNAHCLLLCSQQQTHTHPFPLVQFNGILCYIYRTTYVGYIFVSHKKGWDLITQTEPHYGNESSAYIWPRKFNFC